jgi:hypothetical protein
MSSFSVSFSLSGRALAGPVSAPVALLLAVAISSPAFGICTSDADCDDGVFCNGVESCNLDTHQCVAVSACPPSIPATICNEDTDTCDPYCTSDFDCDDGLFCNGIESCNLDTHQCVAVSACPPSIPPTVCDEVNDSCEIFCTSDLDCNDGLFCNGVETCDLPTNSCVAVSACPPSIPPTICNEDTDTCDSVAIFDDDFESSDTSHWSSSTP